MYHVIPTYSCSTVVLMRIPKVHSYSCSRRNVYASLAPAFRRAQWTIYFHNSEPPPPPSLSPLPPKRPYPIASSVAESVVVSSYEYLVPENGSLVSKFYKVSLILTIVDGHDPSQQSSSITSNGAHNGGGELTSDRAQVVLSCTRIIIVERHFTPVLPVK